MSTLLPSDSHALTALLTRQREDILQRIRARLHGSDDPGALKLANHLAESDEQPAADVENETDLALLSHEQDALQAVENALQRVAEGKAGQCSQCGETIPAARLMATPTAHTCVDCQRLAEQGHVLGARNAH